MSKHTPGPWCAWNSVGGRILSSWRVGERQSTPGVTRPIAVVSNDRTGDEEFANAHLIAAAPELLAALEDLLAVAQGQIDSMDYDRLAIEELIAKAKGGTP